MAKRVPQDGDWSDLVGQGENPFGFIAQTPNGTIINGRGGDGTNRPMLGANPRWNHDPRLGVAPMQSYDHSSQMMVVVPYNEGASLPRRVKRK